MDHRGEKSRKSKLTANGESELMDAFIMAANSVAILYREGLRNTKTSFQMGYEQALQDVWKFASQHSLDCNISKSDLVKFLQEKHSESLSEIEGEKDTAANLETSASVSNTNVSFKSETGVEHSFSFGANTPSIPSFPEAVTHVEYGSLNLKRKWEYHSSFVNENQSVQLQAFNTQSKDQTVFKSLR